MISVKKINKILLEKFNGRVTASEINNAVKLEGCLDNWNDIVKAGSICADKKSRRYVVNNIKLKGTNVSTMKLPKVSDKLLNHKKPDVLIIGAGIVGCAIARELSRWNLDILLVEKEHDVAMQASSRNDGMIHPGIDLKKCQIKQIYNSRGNNMYPQICKDLDVDFEMIGQYLCFKDKWIKYILPFITGHWKKMNVPVKIIDKKELKEKEPYLSDDIQCALHFPTAGIVCPYGLTIAYAENAVKNGVSLSLDTAVLDMNVKDNKIESVTTNRGVIYPKIVINAAGVFSDNIAELACDKFFSIHPRKGTNIILDKKAAYQVATIASLFGTIAVKTTHSKGGGVVSTIDGNLLVGPDAEETYQKEDYSTNINSVNNTINKQKNTSPLLNKQDIITYFTGVRAATYEEDFVICEGKNTKNIIHAAGIQSPGLTAAPAIAVDIADITVKMLAKTQTVLKNQQFNPTRKSIPKTSKLPDKERQKLIEKNSDYGVIICRCEEVSKGEIIDALNRPVPCDTIDGVKRRVRPGMGRCQGGFCSPLVAEIISKEKNIPLYKITKNGDGSNIACGNTKQSDSIDTGDTKRSDSIDTGYTKQSDISTDDTKGGDEIE